jgi:hypothetical protein
LNAAAALWRFSSRSNGADPVRASPKEHAMAKKKKTMVQQAFGLAAPVLPAPVA